MRPAVLPVLIAAVALAACAQKPAPAPAPTAAPVGLPSRTVVVLLPDADTGRIGLATVTNALGSVVLSAERDATVVTADRQPADVRTMSDDDIQEVFGGTLSALPPPRVHFTLFFRFESDELTADSRAQLQDVIRAVGGRPVPDVAIVGHTDTAGASAANVELGLRRAMAVRNLLVRTGVDPSMIEVTSHGEADPAIPTPDDTAEPGNRRVEITVR